MEGPGTPSPSFFLKPKLFIDHILQRLALHVPLQVVAEELNSESPVR